MYGFEKRATDRLENVLGGRLVTGFSTIDPPRKFVARVQLNHCSVMNGLNINLNAAFWDHSGV